MRQVYQIPSIHYDEADANIAHLVTMLRQHGIAYITKLPPSFEQAAATLFDYGDRLFDDLEAGRIKPRLPSAKSGVGKANVIDVLSQRSHRFAGCNFGNRLLTNQVDDASQAQDNTLPIPKGTDQHKIIEAFKTNNRFGHDLFTRLLQQLELQLHLQPGALALGNGPVGLTRYAPVIQGDLAELQHQQQLAVAAEDSDEVVTFHTHPDISPLTLLYYRHGKADGLKIQTVTGEWLPAVFPDDVDNALILFAGRQMQLLTNGYIKPLVHRVTTTPQQAQHESQLPPNKMRHLLAYFGLYAQPDLKPALMLNGQPLPPPADEVSPFDDLVTPGAAPVVSQAALMQQHFGQYSDPIVTDEAHYQRLLEAYPKDSVYHQAMRAQTEVKQTDLIASSKVTSVLVQPTHVSQSSTANTNSGPNLKYKRTN